MLLGNCSLHAALPVKLRRPDPATSQRHWPAALHAPASPPHSHPQLPANTLLHAAVPEAHLSPGGAQPESVRTTTLNTRARKDGRAGGMWAVVRKVPEGWLPRGPRQA